MPKPPTPTQKRYRGRIRADMRSAYNHIQRLLNWNTRYLAAPSTNYPNQLAPATDITALEIGRNQLLMWLDATGPIPSRP